MECQLALQPHLSLLLSLNVHDGDFTKGVLESFNDPNWSYEDFVERIFTLLREECQECFLSDETDPIEESPVAETALVPH